VNNNNLVVYNSQAEADFDYWLHSGNGWTVIGIAAFVFLVIVIVCRCQYDQKGK
jgi:hypothetical protein